MRSLLLALLAVLAVPVSAQAIVGGQTTQREWPHMAALEAQGDDGRWAFICGASLVRADVVLTAAHCVEDDDGATRPAGRFRLLLGTRRRSTGGERIGAVSLLVHPGWAQSGRSSSDVALFRLARASSLGRPVRIAGPSDADRFEPGDPAVVTGWGAEAFGSPFAPDALKEATVPIVSDAECAAAYSTTSTFAGRPEPSTTICAGEREGGSDSCQGDSGGPLHVQDAAGAFVQVGVVSFGLGCAFPSQYGVYAEVAGSVLRPWVEQNASALSGAPAPSGGEPGATSGGGAPAAGTGTAGDSGSPSSPAALRARLRLPSRLGSARRARRTRRLTITLRSSAPLGRIVVTLRRRSRLVAVGVRPSLRTASGRVVLRVRRGLRPGRARLRVSARDALGRQVSAARRVTIRR